MKEKYTYASLDYLGKHKIYCFRRSFSDINPLKRVVCRYKEGDYVPVVNNNYTYGNNVLIVDLKNQRVHIIEDSIYKKTVHISKEVDSSIYQYFRKKRYLSIDIYGRVLSIVNIFDLYRCINSYPVINLYLEEKSKYLKKNICFDYECDNSFITVLNEINQYKSNRMLLSGYIINNVASGKSKEDISFEVAEQINQEILQPLIYEFENEFLNSYDVYSVSNQLLEIFDLIYDLEINKNGKLIKYRSFCKDKVTHIDRLKRDVKRIIDDNSEFDLECIMDIIFLAIDDEEYVEFIISLISQILDINN